MRLCLAGDLMTGRGIDQALPHPARPDLYEPCVRSALEYVRLAEAASGPLPRPLRYDYVWGDALAGLARADLRIANLETAITGDGEPWPGKGIHYRMHPDNIGCLRSAGIDCCTLANNHVLDWGRRALEDTLDALSAARIASTGAGRNAAEAAAPAILERPGARVLVFAFAMPDSGVPRAWKASRDSAGVNFLDDLSPAACDAIAAGVAAHRRPGDVVVVSVHWGGNWGYDVSRAQRGFAHRLIDAGAADVLHGHSSHHPKAIEIHRGRPVLYGCGDLLNDYEGIGGYEAFRPQLAALYLAAIDERPALRLVPYRVRRFRLERAAPEEARWLAARLDRESRGFGTRIEIDRDGELVAHASPEE